MKDKKDKIETVGTLKFSEDMIVGVDLAKAIMEGTGRFELLEVVDDVMFFWENDWDEKYQIQSKWTVGELIEWLVSFFEKDYMERGEERAKRKIKYALGLR